MIFLNIGWMRDYKGITAANGEIKGGGSFVQEAGYGYEMFNFLPYNGYMYGYVQPNKGSIRIERLGAPPKDSSIDDILAIWVAKRPRSGGVFIVGWYNNATVYRGCQPAPEGSKREYEGEKLGYYIKAKAKEEDYRLLPEGERVFQIPRGKGGMGQSNVWYADQAIHASFKKDVLNFMRKFPKSEQPQSEKDKPWPDPYKRQKIEKIAIEKTTKYYENLGYVVDSVEKDNAGWDLEAILHDRLLRIEVKGLSQKEVLIELTPNEYEKMKEYKDSYRICVVTDALGECPLLRRFSFSPESGEWEDDEGNQLKINEIVSARMSML